MKSIKQYQTNCVQQSAIVYLWMHHSTHTCVDVRIERMQVRRITIINWRQLKCNETAAASCRISHRRVESFVQYSIRYDFCCQALHIKIAINKFMQQLFNTHTQPVAYVCIYIFLILLEYCKLKVCVLKINKYTYINMYLYRSVYIRANVWHSYIYNTV